MFDREYLNLIRKTLRREGVRCTPGLTDEEFENVESELGFRFPPDLRALLAFMLPLADEDFPNWRSPRSIEVQRRLRWPQKGVAFDVFANNFWMDEWGAKPTSMRDRIRRSRVAVQAAPKLIQVFGHRYLPASPCVAGNPVFSVWQTDIIVYGNDLPSYLLHEAGIPNPYPTPATSREIEFWSELVRRNTEPL